MAELSTFAAGLALLDHSSNNHMKPQADSTVFVFCVTCGNQLKGHEGFCSSCGADTVEVNRVVLPNRGREGRFGRRDDATQQEDPFYLL
jgi:predicted amidophosphoribosyltransferase